ncbi:unnamed protein product [Ixodes persulcatus]
MTRCCYIASTSHWFLHCEKHFSLRGAIKLCSFLFLNILNPQNFYTNSTN